MRTTDLFTILLAVLFIGLKLTGYISWSWLWVLSPLWIPVLMVAIVISICASIFGYKAAKKIFLRNLNS